MNTTNLCLLPMDVRREIADKLDGNDKVNFTSTCKLLYLDNSDHKLWELFASAKFHFEQAVNETSKKHPNELKKYVKDFTNISSKLALFPLFLMAIGTSPSTAFEAGLSGLLINEMYRKNVKFDYFSSSKTRGCVFYSSLLKLAAQATIGASVGLEGASIQFALTTFIMDALKNEFDIRLQIGPNNKLMRTMLDHGRSLINIAGVIASIALLHFDLVSKENNENEAILPVSLWVGGKIAERYVFPKAIDFVCHKYTPTVQAVSGSIFGVFSAVSRTLKWSVDIGLKTIERKFDEKVLAPLVNASFG